MTLREYLYFKRIYKEIEQKAGNVSWVKNFFMWRGDAYAGPKGRFDEAMPDIYNARNYEEAPSGCYDVGNVAYNRGIDKMLSNMEVLSSYYDKSLNSFNEFDVETEYNTKLDYEFFKRMVPLFSDVNSGESKDIKEQLSEINKVLSAGDVSLKNDEYVEKINQLEESLDAYLQESVFAGVQEKDTDLEVKALSGEEARRINAAIAMKEYIGDIRKEKFKESMRQEIKSNYLRLVKPEDDDLGSAYAKKLAGIDAILSNIDKMVEKHNSINPVDPIKKEKLKMFKDNMRDTRAVLTLCKSGHFDVLENMHGPNLDKRIAGVFIADLALNEVLSNGGETLSPSLEGLIFDTDKNENIFSKYVHHNNLMNKDKFAAFIKKSYKENVLDALHNGLLDISKSLNEATISDGSYRMKKEQRTECYETLSEKATIEMAYDNLARYVWSINGDVIRDKYEHVVNKQRTEKNNEENNKIIEASKTKGRDNGRISDFFDEDDALDEKTDEKNAYNANKRNVDYVRVYNLLKGKYDDAANKQRKQASYDYLRFLAEKKVQKDETVVKSDTENNTDSLSLARYFLDAFSLNRIKAEEHLADNPNANAIDSVRAFVSENNTSTKLSIMQNSSKFKNIWLLQNTPMFKNVLDEITAGNVKDLDDIMKLMPAKEVEQFVENYFENINQTVNAQKEYQEEALSKFALVMDHPVKGDYEKFVKQLIANAGKFSDPSIDSIAESVNLCFGRGEKETEREITHAMRELGKVEQMLSEQMLDDDSDALRKKYAFVINLQSKLEAYMDADEFIEEAKSPTSVYASAYDRIKYRIEKIEQTHANGNDELQSEFKKLEKLAKESMEHIRDAIVSEATGHKKTGIASLRNAKDIGIVAVYNILKAESSNQSRKVLEKCKVDTFLRDVMNNATALKNSCKKLNINTLGELLEDSNKLVKFFEKSPVPAKEAEPVEVKAPVQKKMNL